MPSATRNKIMSDATFDHVVLTLMGLNIKSACYQCLQSNDIRNAFDISFLDAKMLDDLEFVVYDDKGDPIDTHAKIPKYQQNLVICFGDYLAEEQMKNGGMITSAQIMALSKDAFDNFRVQYSKSSGYVAPPSTTSPVVASITRSDELSTFLRGVKRDKSQYPEIKDDRHFENWQRTFLATAASHRIEEIFNPAYIPTTSDELLLFAEKQKFAYTVLDSTLKTDMGKTIVRKYASTGNAQKIWEEFVKDAKASTKAQINASDL
jgi:hypothetical protein